MKTNISDTADNIDKCSKRCSHLQCFEMTISNAAIFGGITS